MNRLPSGQSITVEIALIPSWALDEVPSHDYRLFAQDLFYVDTYGRLRLGATDQFIATRPEHLRVVLAVLRELETEMTRPA